MGSNQIWRSQGAAFWGIRVLLVANSMLEIAVSIRNLLGCGTRLITVFPKAESVLAPIPISNQRFRVA